MHKVLYKKRRKNDDSIKRDFEIDYLKTGDVSWQQKDYKEQMSSMDELLSHTLDSYNQFQEDMFRLKKKQENKHEKIDYYGTVEYAEILDLYERLYTKRTEE